VCENRKSGRKKGKISVKVATYNAINIVHCTHSSVTPLHVPGKTIHRQGHFPLQVLHSRVEAVSVSLFHWFGERNGFNPANRAGLKAEGMGAAFTRQKTPDLKPTGIRRK